ncbi:MAG: UDP-3-O-[3-hydroxymyristoyl] N-acetylglucosamine deacetylase [Elusimicrobia bacterium RIFOXYA2_FULL_39_19]|nr:MAG: UDP-3-O-[3-hydroxymyristoyl] N-acetylglucosamine deacetylase [Elusimicrobia bacterium RIFOXYA2_FULL_39_19]
MDKQKTIKKEITIKGIGLHTGNKTKMTLRPAPINYGIKFIRTDLKDSPVIPALAENVQDILRGTTIGINEIPMVYTVEHLLASFSGLGIDNMQVLLNNNEPPVFDGSAKPFVDYLLGAGIVELDAPKEYIRITEPIEYISDDKVKVEITATPSDEFVVDYTIIYNHPLVGTQQIELKITSEIFINEISKARTFCFDFEIEALAKKGLAKGGNLDNAIIIGLDKIHNPQKLRYNNEFVRHKLLDIIGDFYLLGKPLKAHIKASCSGHKHNINFVNLIKDQIKSKQRGM